MENNFYHVLLTLPYCYCRGMSFYMIWLETTYVSVCIIKFNIYGVIF